MHTTRKEYDKGRYGLIQEVDSRMHGWWIVFHNDNTKDWERFYLHGKQNGPEREWYRNGVLKHERSFRNGKLDGPWKTFYDNGQLKNDCWFTKGKQNLYSRWYSREGNLLAEMTILDGRQHGTTVATIVLDEETGSTTKAIVTHEHGVYKGYEPLAIAID